MSQVKVCIFCSSKDTIHEHYFSEMEKLVKSLVEQDCHLYYGGSNVGLMGHLANSAIKYGGKITGITPEVFNTDEMRHEEIENIYTKDLFERKKMMLDDCDAFIAFPGGMGTMDEALAVLVEKQVGSHDKPVLFLNHFDFWTPLLDFFGELRQRQMLSKNTNEYYTAFEKTEELTSWISQWKGAR